MSASQAQVWRAPMWPRVDGRTRRSRQGHRVHTICMASPATLSRMEPAKFETAALAHVDDSYYFGAYCGKSAGTRRASHS